MTIFEPNSTSSISDCYGLRLVELQNQTRPTMHCDGVQMTEISDKIFGTLETCEREADGSLIDSEAIIIPTAVNDHSTIDSEEIEIPAAVAIGAISAAEVALHWKKLDPSEREALRKKTTLTLIETVKKNRHNIKGLLQEQRWQRSIVQLVHDAINNNSKGLVTLQQGLPPDILASTGSFMVEVQQDPVEQIAAIVRGILSRLHQLRGEDRAAIRAQIAGWQYWKNNIIKVEDPKKIPMMKAIYDNVRIPYEIFRDVVSDSPEIKAIALKYIKERGGFIHEAEEESFEEMLNHGVVKMTTDGSAYYGIVSDSTTVERHLAEMCGFEVAKAQRNEYRTTDDLPRHSTLGWSVEWGADPDQALKMFQHPDQIALSVEVAVRKEDAEKKAVAQKMRHAGIAAALKHSVYTDPTVEDKAWILTRHFQIKQVTIPERSAQPVKIAGAINVGSDIFIRDLGGVEIGSATEKCTIQAKDKYGALHPVELTIRWIFCLAPRQVSIQTIEKKATRG